MVRLLTNEYVHEASITTIISITDRLLLQQQWHNFWPLLQGHLQIFASINHQLPTCQVIINI
jgi:hypothetical protein